MRIGVLFLTVILVGAVVSTPLAVAGEVTYIRPHALPLLRWGEMDVTLDLVGTRSPLSKRTSYSFSRNPSLSFGWRMREELRLGLCVHSDGTDVGVSAGFAYRF